MELVHVKENRISQRSNGLPFLLGMIPGEKYQHQYLNIKNLNMCHLRPAWVFLRNGSVTADTRNEVFFSMHKSDISQYAFIAAFVSAIGE